MRKSLFVLLLKQIVVKTSRSFPVVNIVSNIYSLRLVFRLIEQWVELC